MQFTASPTERTTAATDLLLAAVGLAYAGALVRRGGWRARVWAAAFGAMGLAGGLGAVAHGLRLSQRSLDALWRALYLVLGLTVALFAVAATGDGWGERAGHRALGPMLLVALGFYTASQRLRNGFLSFIIYEAVALLYALAVYIRLAQGGRMDGAQRTAAGILLAIIAAGVQSTTLRATLLGLPFDHNGLFHLVQLAGLPVLASGVQAGLANQ